MAPCMHHDSEFLRFDTMHHGGGEAVSHEEDYALVLLNYRMPLLTLFLWKKACFRICADGGANRLYDSLPTLFPHEDPCIVRERYKPDVIKGDLDSIRPEVKEFYARLGTIILDESYDQDTTDLHKCISYIKYETSIADKCNMKVLVLGALGGRLDHEFANFNVLYAFQSIRIILLSDESMTYLLPRSYTHTIHVNPAIEGPHCGLVPLGNPSSATTTSGLRWNLDNTPMQFGGLISTSNVYASDQVTVSSDTDLIWTTTIERLNIHLKQIISLSDSPQDADSRLLFLNANGTP